MANVALLTVSARQSTPALAIAEGQLPPGLVTFGRHPTIE
jgi:hypothetical protein